MHLLHFSRNMRLFAVRQQQAAGIPNGVTGVLFSDRPGGENHESDTYGKFNEKI